MRWKFCIGGEFSQNDQIEFEIDKNKKGDFSLFFVIFFQHTVDGCHTKI
jgi:hypothetical protein